MRVSERTGCGPGLDLERGLAIPGVSKHGTRETGRGLHGSSKQGGSPLHPLRITIKEIGDALALEHAASRPTSVLHAKEEEEQKPLGPRPQAPEAPIIHDHQVPQIGSPKERGAPEDRALAKIQFHELPISESHYKDYSGYMGTCENRPESVFPCPTPEFAN
jgi:hypothetical protein